MGPGCFHPRNLSSAASSVSGSIASMGPGCFHPRNALMSLRSFRSLHASMGPGCFHPRNLGARAFAPIITELQWGRDVSIPEMADCPLPRGHATLLQWGRDVSIPEIRL